jgi:hypothetical protein
MGRTALLMPVYNEDPERVFTALSRMAMALRREGVARHFDIFVLSDTRKEPVAEAELEAFHWLRRQVSPAVKVFYRRREHNHHRKAGNIADFVQRWGGAYDHMIVLDADSDMSASAMITLARAMAADAAEPLDALCPHDAVRRPRLWPAGGGRPVRLARARWQLLGPQRHHPHARLRGGGGIARTHRAQALRRPRAEP